MTQIWDPQAYSKNGAFVHGLAGDVLEWLAPQPGESILDLGCGDGTISAQFLPFKNHVTMVDISAEMLADAHASAVIVGHSERRSGHHETDADVRAKTLAARRAGLLAIICIGETRAERDAGKAHDPTRPAPSADPTS